MAQASAFKTYDAVGNREDLNDVITIIAREEAPFYERFGKTKAMATYHEWQTDVLASAAANNNIEGSDYTFALATATTRDGNYTQILDKDVKVSRTQDLVNTAGRSNEMDYQKAKKLRELMIDIEYALVNGSGNSGASGTARELKGVLAYITTNVTIGSGTGTETLTEDMYNDNLQAIWDVGGAPNATYANSFQKRKISGFSTSNTRNINTEGGRLVNTVSVYESDFGILQIIADHQMTSTVVANLQDEYWKVSLLDPIHYDDVPNVGRYNRGVWETEITLESLNELASGKITQLATAN